MFGIKTLIEKLNTAISGGGLTETQLAQAFGAIDSLENRSVNSIDTFSNLPLASLNKGRFFWIQDENRYVLSNGVTWDIDNITAGVTNLNSWGSNTSGDLGDNTTVNKSSPVFVVGGFADWMSVSAGHNHNLGIRTNGTLWAWGAAAGGVLGNNSTVDRSSPVSVVGGFTDWVQVSTGGEISSLGVRADGTLWAWGYNTFGQLGDNSATARSSPVPVVGGIADWVQVSANSFHSLGVRASGTLYSWGGNGAGQLGDNTTVSKSSPVLVAGGFTDWIQGSAGYRYSLGLRANGTLYAWGYNGSGYGNLGDNTTVSKSSPVLVVGGFTDWVQASAGRGHNLALRGNGTLYAWGRNAFGNLGDNTTVSKSSPVLVVGGFTDWVQTSAGGAHSLGVRANGTLWAWGYNTQGGLGILDASAKSSPMSVVGGFTNWVQASAGSSASSAHSLGLKV